MSKQIPLVLFLALLGTSSGMGQAGQTNALGICLPDDAAPLEQQRVRLFEIDGTYLEWFKTVYKRTAGVDLISEPLVRINKDFELIPAGALSWEVTPDGNTWIFHLRAGMQWDDGKPLTAHDYVFTFRRGADPANAYDFEWYYRTIKNWGRVVAGEIPLDSLGVEAYDDLTLAIHTEQAIPYLPYNVIYSWPSPQQAVTKYGDAWSSRPETIVSSGPFRLTEWRKNERMVLSLNPTYRGAAPPYLQEVVYYLYSQAGQPPMLSAYEAGEVDMILLAGQAALGRVKSEPVLESERHSAVAFITYYLAMDTYNSVFKDLRVRQAFSHAIDRQALMASVLKDVAVPAYSMLPPAFPGAKSAAFKDIQRYDPALARHLLAEAGFPNGRGFPGVDIWLRGRDAHESKQAAEAIQAMLSQVLGINVGVRTVETKVFMDALNNHTLTLALVPYAYDYPDPSNLLGLWLASGRHAWYNKDFERLVSTANGFMGDRETRFQLYHQAEKILVEDVGGVFIWHPIQHWLWKSYLRSPDLEPNRLGMEFWSVNALMTGYITADRTQHAGAVSPSVFGRVWQWLASVLN